MTENTTNPNGSCKLTETELDEVVGGLYPSKNFPQFFIDLTDKLEPDKRKAVLQHANAMHAEEAYKMLYRYLNSSNCGLNYRDAQKQLEEYFQERFEVALFRDHSFLT